jgi:hypothetical protein
VALADNASHREIKLRLRFMHKHGFDDFESDGSGQSIRAEHWWDLKVGAPISDPAWMGFHEALRLGVRRSSPGQWNVSQLLGGGFPPQNGWPDPANPP